MRQSTVLLVILNKICVILSAMQIWIFELSLASPAIMNYQVFLIAIDLQFGIFIYIWN